MHCVDSLEEADLVFLVGKSTLTREVESWLEKKRERQVVVLDAQDPFYSPENPRVRFFFLPEEGREEVYKQIAWQYLFLRFYYAEPKDPLICALQQVQQAVHLIASDRSDPELRVVRNALTNIRKMREAKPGEALFGKFKGMPALICGVGPSLKKNGHLLNRVEGRALLFGAGSALAFLKQQGVAVDFAAAIDPAPPGKRFPQKESWPLFYQNRVDSSLLEQAASPLLYLPDSGSSLVDRALFEGAFFDGGWNAATFSAAIAVALGCSPILFVGLDLAAERGAIYAPGIVPQPEEKPLISVEDEAGRRFLSKLDWMAARSWLSGFVGRHPDVRFLNATEGGMGVPGVEAVSLEQAVMALPPREDLKERVASALKELPGIASAAESVRRAEEMEESLRRVNALCTAFLERAGEIFPSPAERDGKGALLLLEIEEERATKALLSFLWEVWKHPLLRESPEHPELQKALLYLRLTTGF